jgi:hypothetical protein
VERQKEIVRIGRRFENFIVEVAENNGFPGASVVRQNRIYDI